MAVVEMKNASTLKIKLNLGLVDGKAKVSTKSFSYLKHDANIGDVYEVGQALVGLQKHDLVEILKIDNAILSEEF